MSVTDAQFKAALSAWPSGVTVVTSRDGERIHGMTVSAFASVSLEPRLVSVCLDQQSITLELIRAARRLAVNILAADQGPLSNHFASRLTEADRFNGIEYALGQGGCPLLNGACASIECSLFALHQAGDHVLVLGEVLHATLNPLRPLLYHDRRYGGFTAS